MELMPSNANAKTDSMAFTAKIRLMSSGMSTELTFFLIN